MLSATLDEQAARVAGLLTATEGTIPEPVRPLGGEAWLVRCGAELLVLKRGRPEQDAADVTWEHDYLRRLAATGFSASVPVPVVDGQSWACVDGRIWASLTYLPGRPLVSEPAPDQAAAGAFLARYHRAARRAPALEQRPTAAGLARLRAVTPWERVATALGGADALDRFARLLGDLEDGLRDLHYETLEQLVIHGDATNDNLIVDGTPPRIVGLIDFGAAHLAAWPADLAAALWRSGRPYPDAVECDLDRVRRYVAGYHRESPLPSRLARAIPLLMQGRGLQLISRRVRRLPPDQPIGPMPDVTLSLRRAGWLHVHRAELISAVTSALTDGEGRRNADG
jgi:Ser/Thr protein kinase RdoA (MazF antagonist)